MDISAVSLQGMEKAQDRLDITARRLAHSGDPVDTFDLSAEMTALLESRNAFLVNARMLKAANATRETLIDLLA